VPVELISKIEPKTSGGGAGEFPMVEDRHLEGGFQVRADVADRDAIYTLNRKEGMFVYLLSNSKIYKLQGGITNLDWVEVTIGGGVALTAKRSSFLGSAFSFAAGVSSVAIAPAPNTDVGLLDMRDLWRNGVYLPTMVSGTPAVDGEWRLTSTHLEVYGSLNAADQYTVRYPT